MTRDTTNPQNTVANDPLGNYSLTLIDSLSTLAIIASSTDDGGRVGAKALRDFQDGVSALILQYGDGTGGRSGKGLRARSFDIDSTVQVFETVIRGVGGLLSAHLFASGELPIRGYVPRPAHVSGSNRSESPTILWPNGLKYNGQLLRLALDLAQRLLPAFFTPTGLPYPRVNLRYGVPFHTSSPLYGGIKVEGPRNDDKSEMTETCSAAAGSLLLEFTVLSRLIDDPRFENIAKRSFWAVWSRRSKLGLLGAALDTETGHWNGAYSGVGAGIDSFFEYAYKMSVLISAQDIRNTTISPHPLGPVHRILSDSEDQDLKVRNWLDPNSIFPPLSAQDHSPEAFLAVWRESHATIKRHLYSSLGHPHYNLVHLVTGAPQAYWIDALGAFYPGLLALAGELEEAVEIQLLYTALWTRYSALPERWSVVNGDVEGGLGWWLGRPEFIESNYHLYTVTKDPYYLYVGKMILQDIKRRCLAPCGWSGLQDVRTGELNDRMESFFLSESVQYLYLLFDTEHPLHSLDNSWIFSTEGHPLVLPRNRRRTREQPPAPLVKSQPYLAAGLDTCPISPNALDFSVSPTAARADIFHASSLVGLSLIPLDDSADGNETSVSRSQKMDYSYYPWTLPPNLIPADGTCSRPQQKTTFTVEFPLSQFGAARGTTSVPVAQSVVRLNEGILVKSLGGLRLGMVLESTPLEGRYWRVWSIANMHLGRDEQIILPRDVVGNLADHSFKRVRDPIMLDLIVQTKRPTRNASNKSSADNGSDKTRADPMVLPLEGSPSGSQAAVTQDYHTLLNSLINQMSSVLGNSITGDQQTRLDSPQPPLYSFAAIPAITSTGIGSAPLKDIVEAPAPYTSPGGTSLAWTSIFFAGKACEGTLPVEAVRKHNVIVMERGGCTFSEKMGTIPSFTPSSGGLQMVIVVSEGDAKDKEDADGEEGNMIRPLLDQEQTTPSGLLRANTICMVLVGGGHKTIQLLKRASSVEVHQRYYIETNKLIVRNIIIV